MNFNIFSLSVVFSLLFVLMVLNLVRRNRLKEQYALLWLFFGVVMLVTVWQIRNLDPVARFLGIINPPNLLFLVGIIFTFALILHLTVVVSKMDERIVRLTQEIAILKQKEQKKGIGE